MPVEHATRPKESQMGPRLPLHGGVERDALRIRLNPFSAHGGDSG